MAIRSPESQGGNVEPQPDQWPNKLPDGRTVVYGSDIGPGLVGGPIDAQAEGDIIKHTDIATCEMNRHEIEAIFAERLAK
jgi:hypothetical protein